MGHRRSPFAAVFALVLLSAPPARAWNDTGHMTVALIAYQELEPATQVKAIAILKAGFKATDDLPQFKKDLTAGMPDDLTPAEQNRYIFAKAATWPDIIRDEDHPCREKFHKGAWHFINLPYVAPGDATPVPPDPVPTPVGQEPKDILSAIKLCLKDVKSENTPAHLRAARLCFLLHTLGDLHQPLHCAAQFSNDGLKHGDLGGNKQLLRRKGSEEGNDTVISIHSIFDQLLGRERRFDKLVDRATELSRSTKLRRKALADFLKQNDPAEWAKESLADAIEVAYLKGTLKTFRGKTAFEFTEGNLNRKLVPEEPDDYEKNARPVAERRAVLAGYRLADLLGEILP